MTRRITEHAIAAKKSSNLSPEKLLKLITGNQPKPGHVRLGPEKKEQTSGGAPPPPPPPPQGGQVSTLPQFKSPPKIQYKVAESLAPDHVIADSRTIVGSSVGVSSLQNLPSVGWSWNAGSNGPGGHDSITIEGTDFYRPITNAEIKQAAGNNIIANGVPVNPLFLNLPRLNALAVLFERFHFEHFEFIYCQACSSAVTGGMVGYFERDPDDSQPDGLLARLQSAFSHTGVAATQYWTGCRWVLPPNPGDYFVDSGSENRLVYQGIFRLLNEVASTSSEAPGILMVRYKCRLWQSKFDGSTGSSAPSLSWTIASGLSAANPLGIGAFTAGSKTTWTGPYITATTTQSFFCVPAGYAAVYVTFRFQATAATTAAYVLVNCSQDSGDYYSQGSGSTTASYTAGGVFVSSDITMPMEIGISLTTLNTPTATWVAAVPIRWASTFASAQRMRKEIGMVQSRLVSLSERLKLLEYASVSGQEGIVSESKSLKSDLTTSPSTSPRSRKGSVDVKFNTSDFVAVSVADDGDEKSVDSSRTRRGLGNSAERAHSMTVTRVGSSTPASRDVLSGLANKR
jgi:hypothetical protein